MRNVVLAGACRTPICTMGGALSSKSAVELGTLVISEALKRAGVPASEGAASSRRPWGRTWPGSAP